MTYSNNGFNDWELKNQYIDQPLRQRRGIFQGQNKTEIGLFKPTSPGNPQALISGRQPLQTNSKSQIFIWGLQREVGAVSSLLVYRLDKIWDVNKPLRKFLPTISLVRSRVFPKINSGTFDFEKERKKIFAEENERRRREVLKKHKKEAEDDELQISLEPVSIEFVMITSDPDLYQYYFAASGFKEVFFFDFENSELIKTAKQHTLRLNDSNRLGLENKKINARRKAIAKVRKRLNSEAEADEKSKLLTDKEKKDKQEARDEIDDKLKKEESTFHPQLELLWEELYASDKLHPGLKNLLQICWLAGEELIFADVDQANAVGMANAGQINQDFNSIIF